MQTEAFTDNKRVLALDLIRIFVIFNVIWGHCLEYFGFNLPFSSFMYAIDKTSGPLFLMLTGALFIPRNFELKSFFKNKLLFLYIVSVFWFFIYGIINLPYDSNLHHAYHIIRPNENLFSYAIHDSLILRTTAEHLWYLSTILLIYFLLPWLSGIKNFSTKSIFCLIFGCCLYKWLDMFLGFGHTVGSYIIYIMYVFWGYVIFNRKLYERISLKAILSLFIITAIVFQFAISSDFYFKLFHGYDPWWINSPFIVFFSLEVYVLLFKLINYVEKFFYNHTGVIKEFSQCIFGVYVIHYMILLKLISYTNNIFLGYLITLILSFIVVLILSRIPIIKLLLYRK